MSIHEQLLKEAMQTLKYCMVDADKIVQNCNQRDVTLEHVTIAAEVLRDMAANQYKRLTDILEINTPPAKE